MTINLNDKKKIIFILFLLVFIILQSFNFFDFISGNTVIHAVLSKYLSKNGELFINFVGDDTRYFLHIHTTLYSHLLTILNHFSNNYFLNVKILNFVILVVFLFWYLKFFREKFDYFAVLVWLFIPTIFHSFSSSDPGMSLGYIFPVILLYLLDKQHIKLVDFFYIGLTIFFYFWTKEISALFFCISIVLSSIILKRKIFYPIIILIFSISIFLISYIFYLNIYDAPFNLVNLFSSHQNSSLGNLLIGNLYFLKGLFLWVGVGLCYFLIFNLNLFKNVFRNFSNLVIIIFFSIYVIISLLNGALFPRYLNECLLPLLIIVLRKFENFQFEFNIKELTPLFIIFFFTIFFTKDISITTNNFFSNTLNKSLIIFFPLLIYFIFNYKNLSNLKINFLITYVFLPSVLIIYFQVNSDYKNYVQGNYLKGYDHTIHFVNDIKNEDTIIIIDNLDLSLYFDNEFLHSNIVNDIPNYFDKSKEHNKFKVAINTINNNNYIYIDRGRYSKEKDQNDFINSDLFNDNCSKKIEDFVVNYSCILK